MSKVDKSKRRMKTYYAETTHQKFVSDLESSGFKVGVAHESKALLSDPLMTYREIAAGREADDTLVSKDGSIVALLK